jgi:hypothetical protein
LGLARIRENAGNGNYWHYYDWFKTYRQEEADGSGDAALIGEDQAFSKRLQYCGESVYIDQRFTIGHIGSFTYLPKHGVKGAVTI